LTAKNNYAVRWAAWKGHLLVVKYLYENGADLTACDNDAVRYAVYEGHLLVVKYLVENGADFEVVKNVSPVMYYRVKMAIQNEKYEEGLSKLRAEIKELRAENTELKYRPGGPGFEKAKKSFTVSSGSV